MSALKHFDSPHYYLLFRVVFGIYLAIHFFSLLPYADELFSHVGMLPKVESLPTYPYFPNLLFVFGDPLFCKVFVAALGCLSFLLSFGIWPKVVPVLLWYGWACLLTRNIFIRNPGMPYVGWMLLALPFVPDVYPRGEMKDWRFPRSIYVAAWCLLAIGYTVSGLHKLQSPSWIDGSALSKLVENPLSRPTVFSAMMKDMPFILQQIGTWTALFLEVSFAFLAIIPRLRPWIWLALVGMHINIMLVVDFVDLTFGMIMIHLFTVDQRWIPAKKIKQPLIIYFDGVCSLCNGFVDSLIKEDSGRSLRYASLQSQAAIDAGVSIKDQTPTSVVVSDGDRVYTESDAVIRIAEGLGGVWRLMVVAKVIPKSLRNIVYRTIAKNRYRWFGKRETCRLPTAAERELFIG